MVNTRLQSPSPEQLDKIRCGQSSERPFYEKRIRSVITPFKLRHICQIAATITAGKNLAERTTLFFNDYDGTGKIASIRGAERRKNSGSAAPDDKHIDFLDCMKILVQPKNL
jgi:hypothetical protein